MERTLEWDAVLDARLLVNNKVADALGNSETVAELDHGNLLGMAPAPLDKLTLHAACEAGRGAYDLALAALRPKMPSVIVGPKLAAVDNEVHDVRGWARVAQALLHQPH